ncbi:LysR family transcriptional regulator [Labrys monachus]|uniref:DNA-binding transcriptional LysR family regulator n=1 Tax=Labrys monachus TaxID=217067 RepID=A0ABU0FHT7_9HYPH|nr:LysR family transcriptional regulator [Labrys monachus]MDQ0394036.1 DNA-binding transcriptional LysR family regulator [Labrys monachus]
MVHSSPKLPPLDTLETFAHAARLGSFSAAAEQIGLTHGAVSRQIGRLERWMGVRLFDREARGVMLTPEGMRFLARAEEALALLEDDGERWPANRRTKSRGRALVRLSVTPSVASLWLFSRLARLEGTDLHVELVLEHRLADFAEGIDLAIRCGKGPWAGVRGMQLWRETLFPVAAPALAQRLAKDTGGAPDAADLFALPILHDSNVEGWRRWLAAAGLGYTARIEDRRFEDYNLVLDACVQGLGVALARPPLTEAALAAGLIVPISSQSVENLVAFHLIRPDEALRGPAAEFARRFLEEAGHGEGAIAGFLASTARQKG